MFYEEATFTKSCLSNFNESPENLKNSNID